MRKQQTKAYDECKAKQTENAKKVEQEIADYSENNHVSLMWLEDELETLKGTVLKTPVEITGSSFSIDGTP